MMEDNGSSDKYDHTAAGLLPSIEALVRHLHPSISAQTGSCVVVPSIINSTVGSLNINISQGSVAASNESVDHGAEESFRSLSIDKVAECRRKLRETLKRKFSHLQEGLTTEEQRKKTALRDIYTELYITEGGNTAVNREHEVRQIEATSRRHLAQEKVIHCNELFTAPPGKVHSHIRTVITRGVAGIGKTMSTSKFTLDWAETTANTDLDFVFPLAFRELNVRCKDTCSFVDFMDMYYPETKGAGIFKNSNCKMLFILDGLDESRLRLDFQTGEIVCDVSQQTTIAVLLINLIRGRLLPLSQVWITSRPAASGQIPAEYVDLVTEVRGFNNQQKEEYFRRKILDEPLANRVISHVKSCRSLHIMCHIPVFCWMAASVLSKQLSARDSKDTPRTLTEMYIQFVTLYHKNMKKRLPERRDSSADVRSDLISLGKLAFTELEKGHLIFHETDLMDNEIDVSKASMFSGVYTEIFSEESLLGEEKMFCFVHLSIQEFFAALYVHLMFHNSNINILMKKSSASRWFQSRHASELIFYKEAVEKALRCENGEFDIFLRFLLGLSLESSQTLLKHLMTSNRTNQKTRGEIIRHVKEKIRASPSTERCLNLFHCLSELNDHSLVEEIQSFLGSGGLNNDKLSPAQWSTLVFVLLTSEDELRVFELGNYSRSEEGLLRLLPVVKTAQVANLRRCQLTAGCCEVLATCISSSQMTEVDLSENQLMDCGLSLLSAGLGTSKVETLRLRSCNMTEQSCEVLASLISSETSKLKVLDLADNDLQDSGISRLSGGLGSPSCQLETLDLCLCGATEEGCTFLASALVRSRLKELDFSYNHPGELGLQLLSTLQDDPQCTLLTLRVEECGESRIQPPPKKYVTKLSLDPNTAHKDLSLSADDTQARRWTQQPYPDHPRRFDFSRQVLCREALSGRCYWETVWSVKVLVGVAYGRMRRKGEGKESWLGRNDSSWGLICSTHGCRVVHNDTNVPLAVPLPLISSSNRVGVFLDWPLGALSFYLVSTCGALTLLHTFHTTFTEPVYPGFELGWVDATIRLC